ncbi:MAG: hypothetical protein N3B21_06810 [Clostridia bacterium]|nr:hypothetical protein [Clostridia bacterium]
MDLSSYPSDVQEYINELIKRRAIGPESLKDKTLMNHLASQRFDRDYLDSMINDR